MSSLAPSLQMAAVDEVNPAHKQPKFDLHKVLHQIQHYLPAQAPLKDFIHHNTLHAFQHLPFKEALVEASSIFGYRVSLSLKEYRTLYHKGRIHPQILKNAVQAKFGTVDTESWIDKLLHKTYAPSAVPRIGMLRHQWKKHYKIDLDSLVHPLLFRILASYLDQGIAIWSFPKHKGFLASLRHLEQNSLSSFFRGKRARQLLKEGDCSLPTLLKLLVGDERLYEQYLFDQQFMHQGWSGIITAVEQQPEGLLDTRSIKLEEVIAFELLLELDALDYHNGKGWAPLGEKVKQMVPSLFGKVPLTELQEICFIWQQALEWSYYDQVLAGIQLEKTEVLRKRDRSFQALFCIDDRECSLRRYIEQLDQQAETFGTPGFFGVEFFFQPEGGKFHTKVCPNPVTPKFLVKEAANDAKIQKEFHFHQHTTSFYTGWLASHILGFWSGIRLLLDVFRPSATPAAASSFHHMKKHSKLTIENIPDYKEENNLQVGFTVVQMATRVENLLKSIGLVKDFANLVYVVGHGSSSNNNPHYAAYDCGACSGRPGSVNARVLSFMANHPEVRGLLAEKGIIIPDKTQFIGALHDTTRDEILFFDEDTLNPANVLAHQANERILNNALDLNAKERSRRFVSVNTKASLSKLHQQIKQRSVSLFEPRPELNHATNALCIIGRRALSKGLFLDRRSFLNSYDYNIDPDGHYLFNIIKAAAPVCGGINLEYYFSRVDNQKLGAGTKLPHNVIGLFGVANGIDGDLRPGLPSQMVEVHDPIRLMIIVEHHPAVVLKTIQQAPETYEWFINEWVHLAVIDPANKKWYYFSNGSFHSYRPLAQHLEVVRDLAPIIESADESFPVYRLNQHK